MTPVRIQLSRAKGWKMPENTVKVDRSTRWGNPFTVNDLIATGYNRKHLAAAYCVSAFSDWLRGDNQNWMGDESDKARASILDNIAQLRGKNLACWCGEGPCHADVLLELANKPEGDA